MRICEKLFGIFLIATFMVASFAEYDQLCARVAEGMKFREPGNCQAYVTCTNGTGTLTTCPKDQLYDKEKKKCVDSLSDSYCKEKCKNKKDSWISDPANCDGYFYCQSGKTLKGSCPAGFHFNEKSQMCIFSSDSECNDVSDFCGILPSSTSFSDPDNCNKYFQCSKLSLRKVNCKGGLYYDAASGECKSLFEVPCKAHPIPGNVCGLDIWPTSNTYVNDKMSCRGYYYCAYKGKHIADKKPSWYQCAEGLFFNDKTKSCADPTETKCNYNRCEGRGDLLVVSEDFGCRHYYACENNLVKEKRKCPKDMFFDEQKQACTFNETFYPVCDF